MPERFHVATFGCRTNQADSAALGQDFLDAGYEESAEAGGADVIVVNSCTVTHRSDQQVRQLVRRFRRENPKARLVVTGCYAQREPEALARIPGVDAVVGNTHKGGLVSLSGRLEARPAGIGELAAIYRDDFSKVRSIELGVSTQLGGRTRPFVKIQDGCDAKCSYCIIPAVRGPSRSVPPQQVLERVRELVAEGFQEVVLTGIHIGTYGMHLQPRFPLDRLLREMLEIRGLAQVRVSSIEPMQLSRRVIALAADSGGRIAPHFHICLQSGCDRTLRRMLRPYDTARFAAIVEEIRELLPEAGIGSDVIAGFPGETEDDHRESLEFVRRMPFTYLHVFPYSDRSGTAASGMAEKVDPAEIRRRARQFRRLSERKNRAFRRSFVGRQLPVLTLDQLDEGKRVAISGNYLKVKVDSRIVPNRILKVKIGGEDGEYLCVARPSRP